MDHIFEGVHIEEQKPEYDCLLFDLDDTLYPPSSGLSKACCKNIQDYLLEKLGVEREKIPHLVDLLYQNYGTTMAGLRAIGFVHGRLPYENLKPDLLLRSILLTLPARKVIFTNADRAHAVRVLARLGLEDCFDGIVCFETLNRAERGDEVRLPGPGAGGIFDIVGHSSASGGIPAALPETPILCKPSLLAIERALDLVDVDPRRTVRTFGRPMGRSSGLTVGGAHIILARLLCGPVGRPMGCHLGRWPDPSMGGDLGVYEAVWAPHCVQVFFDDSARNVLSGKRAGLRTVLVGSPVKGVDFALESIHNMREALPELWTVESRSDVNYSENFTVATSVLA